MRPQTTLLLLLLFIAPLTALAQTTGSLTVRVIGPDGKNVRNAEVTIINLSSGEEHTAKTNTEGIAKFAALPPAQYSVKASKPNLGSASGEPVLIETGKIARSDISLTQTFATGAEPPPPPPQAIEPGDPLSDQPNLNNDLSNFLRVATGAAAGSVAALGKIVVDGKGREQQTLTLDGLDVTLLAEPPTGDPALGVIDSLLKTNVAFDQNRSDTLAGAITTKPSKFSKELPYDLSFPYGPGTGSLILGSSNKGNAVWNFFLYDAYRNDALNTRNFFDYEGKNGLRRNQFGLKTDVAINDKVSLFLGYDGIRGRVERAIYEAIPIDAACPCAQETFGPFMSAFLPANTTIHNSSQNADFLTARRRVRSISGSDSFDARFDVEPFELNSTTTLNEFYLRYTQQSARFVVPDGVTGRRQHQSLVLRNAVTGLRIGKGGNTHQFRFGFNQNRSALDVRTPYSAIPELAQSLIVIDTTVPVANLPGQLTEVPLTIPTASVGGLVKGGVGRGFKQNPISFNASYDLTMAIGDEDNFVAGFESRFLNFTMDRFGGLTYTFADVPNLRAGTTKSVNFLSDLGSESPFSPGTGPRRIRQQTYLTYAQYDLKLSPNLQLKFGLRYDYFGPIYERDNRASIVDPETGESLSSTSRFFETDKLNFQPRIGLSYQLSDSVTLRGGAGFYSGVPRPGDLLLPIESDRINSGMRGGTFPFPSSDIVRQFISNRETREYQPLSFARDFKTPERIYRWDAMLTKTFKNAFDLNFTYSGSVGRQLPVAGVSNQIIGVQTNVDPTQPAVVVRQFDNVRNGEVFKPFGELLFRSSVGRSSFNGLTIQFRRNRTDHELGKSFFDWRNFRSFNAQYTLSRNVGNVSGTVVSIPNDFDSDYGYNAADARHILFFNTTYRFWKKDVRPQNGKWGWTVSPTISARSGLPLIIRLDRPDVVYVDSTGTIFSSPAVGRTAVLNTPGGGATGGARVPNLIPGEDPYNHNGVVFLNAAAFAIPKPGEFGNLKRGQLRGPATFQVDLAVTRTLFLKKTKEDTLVGEIKVEIFNIFNRANFVNPTASLPNSLGTSLSGDRIQPSLPFTRSAAGQFGVITGADPGRTLQFTLSFRFNDGY